MGESRDKAWLAGHDRACRLMPHEIELQVDDDRPSAVRQAGMQVSMPTLHSRQEARRLRSSFSSHRLLGRLGSWARSRADSP